MKEKYFPSQNMSIAKDKNNFQKNCKNILSDSFLSLEKLAYLDKDKLKIVCSKFSIG